MPKRSNFGTEAVLNKIYPIIEHALDTRKNNWLRLISLFMQKRSAQLFDIAPCDRIFYTDEDRTELVSALNISFNEIRTYLKDTYYWNIGAFKPSQAKDEVTIICLCVVRYFALKKDQKNLELAMIYQAFSGKYYPSIHFGFFRTVAPSKYRHIMEYVVNHKLFAKYDLKAKGSVIGAIKSINATWAQAYAKQIKDFDDEDICYIIQQIHNRIKSFMKNIAALYYEAYENKEYISYDKDSLPEEGDTAAFHLSTNDSFKLQQVVERTMEKITTSQVDYSICKSCADSNVKVEEVRSIIETVLEDKEKIALIREYLTLMVASFMNETESREINSVRFIRYCVKPKPNTKDRHHIRIKEIIEGILDDVSIGYRKRKHREATKQSYHFALNMYIALMTVRANKNG